MVGRRSSLNERMKLKPPLLQSPLPPRRRGSRCVAEPVPEVGVQRPAPGSPLARGRRVRVRSRVNLDLRFRGPRCEGGTPRLYPARRHPGFRRGDEVGRDATRSCSPLHKPSSSPLEMYSGGNVGWIPAFAGVSGSIKTAASQSPLPRQGVPAELTSALVCDARPLDPRVRGEGGAIERDGAESRPAGPQVTAEGMDRQA
jgi:hypothetical protein